MAASSELDSFTATHVYADSDGGGNEISKFVVRFSDPTINFRHIESIRIEGPDGYAFDIAVRRIFDPNRKNGFLIDLESGRFWYMAFDERQFVPEGDYTAVVHYIDGRIARRSRALRRNRPMLQAYLQRRGEMNYQPRGSVTTNDLGAVEFRWPTLTSLGGPDAFYSLWVSAGHTEWADLRLTVFSEDIYHREPDYGRNESTRLVSLKPGPHTWFTEILDSNRLDDINLVIFQPSQWIVVENRVTVSSGSSFA